MVPPIIRHRFGHQSGLEESSGRNSTTFLHGIALSVRTDLLFSAIYVKTLTVSTTCCKLLTSKCQNIIRNMSILRILLVLVKDVALCIMRLGGCRLGQGRLRGTVLHTPSINNILTNIVKYWTSFESQFESIWELSTKFSNLST